MYSPLWYKRLSIFIRRKINWPHCEAVCIKTSNSLERLIVIRILENYGFLVADQAWDIDHLLNSNYIGVYHFDELLTNSPLNAYICSHDYPAIKQLLYLNAYNLTFEQFLKHPQCIDEHIKYTGIQLKK